MPFRTGWLVGVLLLSGLLALAPASVKAGANRQAGSVLPAEIGPPDEALRILFTPAGFPDGTFVVHRSTLDIGELAGRLKARDPMAVDGAWHVERSGVFDAFGAEGPYDKARLARLFGGLLPSVARGSLVTTAGRLAITLLSPCPDVSLSSLRPETMVIVTKLPGRAAQRLP